MGDVPSGPLIAGAAIDEEALRQMVAQDAIRTGRLPRRPANRMWGGAGNGETCTLCGLAMTSQELGYELEFAEGGEDLTTHFLHIRCFAAWESECRKGDSTATANQHDETTPGTAQLNGHRREPGP